jgi:hypothetical protein
VLPSVSTRSKGKPTRDDQGHKAGERQPLSFELRHANAKQPVSAARLCCEPRYPEWGLPASRRSDHIRVRRSCRIRAGAEATIRLLCRCATDLPAIRRCARARKGTPLHTARSPEVKRQAIFLARWAGRGAFKATALVLAFVIIVALWLWNASLLTTAADQNLRIIKTLTQLLPSNWASKAESALRIFGADRALRC